MEFPECKGRLVEHLDRSIWFCASIEYPDGSCSGYDFEHRAGPEPCSIVEAPCPAAKRPGCKANPECQFT